MVVYTDMEFDIAGLKSRLETASRYKPTQLLCPLFTNFIILAQHANTRTSIQAVRISLHGKTVDCIRMKAAQEITRAPILSHGYYTYIRV